MSGDKPGAEDYYLSGADTVARAEQASAPKRSKTHSDSLSKQRLRKQFPELSGLSGF